MYVYNCTVERVIDGDTVDVKIDLGFDVHYRVRVRLLGIDTPETRTKDLKEKAKGLESKSWLANWVERNKDTIFIRTQYDKRGKFGRVLGELYTRNNADESANDILLRLGLAKAYDGGKR